MKINIDFPIETEFYEFKTSLAELDKRSLPSVRWEQHE